MLKNKTIPILYKVWVSFSRDDKKVNYQEIEYLNRPFKILTGKQYEINSYINCLNVWFNFSSNNSNRIINFRKTKTKLHTRPQQRVNVWIENAKAKFAISHAHSHNQRRTHARNGIMMTTPSKGAPSRGGLMIERRLVTGRTMR